MWLSGDGNILSKDDRIATKSFYELCKWDSSLLVGDYYGESGTSITIEDYISEFEKIFYDYSIFLDELKHSVFQYFL